MAVSYGSSHLKKDVTKLLRLDPWGTGQALNRGRHDSDPNEKLLLPRGFELVLPDPDVRFSQLRLKVPKTFAPSYRRAFGYVADIMRIDSLNTASPLLLTVILKLPFKYRWNDDQPWSWTYVRVTAFSSNAAVSDITAIVIGDPITGVLVASSSRYKTAQLYGWKPNTGCWEPVIFLLS